MCTSHIAGNTQRLVSMGKQHKSKAMVVINAMAWKIQRCRRGYRCGSHLKARTVVDDDESLAKMSGGDGDAEPYLYSRNTIGHGNHNPKSQRPKRVKIDIGGSGEWWWCLRKAVVVCGSKRGHRGKIERKYAEMGAGDGVAAGRGRMSGPAAGCLGRRMSGGHGADVRALDQGRTR